MQTNPEGVTYSCRLSRPDDGALAWIAAWMGYALAGTVYGWFALESAEGATAVQHGAYALAHGLALGLASGLVSRGLRGTSPRRRGLAWFAIALALGVAMLRLDLGGPARKLTTLTGIPQGLTLGCLIVGVATFIGAAVVLGPRLRRFTAARWLLAMAPVAAGVVNHLIFPRELPAAHLFLAWGAVAVAAGVGLPSQREPPKFGRSAVVAASVMAVAGLVVPAPLQVRSTLAADGSAVLSPYVVPRWPTVTGDDVDHDDPWWEERSAVPPVPPTDPPLLTEPPLVVYVSIDALRFDILDDPRPASRLPNLAQLRREAVEFSRARSPGTQTAYVLSSVFTGKYYSQLWWTPRTNRWGTEIWPHADTTPRFPALLSERGVRTVNLAATPWLLGEFGVVAGFSEDVEVRSPQSIAPASMTHWAAASDLTDALIERLDAEGPAFLFVHYLDAHHPYDQGGRPGPPLMRYVDELAIVDRQLGRIREALGRPELRDRAVLIVTADHGEAFGEHGVHLHATTLYDEVLRVPLWLSAPGLGPRRIDEPVTLMDLGPTILDLFGAPTPGPVMGRSLLPLVMGGEDTTSRPIAAETRGKQALVRDGLKVILDSEAGSVEVYDLREDPYERTNLAGTSDEVQRAIDQTAAFFEVHRLQREGYVLRWRR